MDEGRGRKGFAGKGKFGRESMNLETREKRRERSTGFENDCDGALVGEGGVAEHRNKVTKTKGIVGVAGDEGCPRNHIG